MAIRAQICHRREHRRSPLEINKYKTPKIRDKGKSALAAAAPANPIIIMRRPTPKKIYETTESDMGIFAERLAHPI